MKQLKWKGDGQLIQFSDIEKQIVVCIKLVVFRNAWNLHLKYWPIMQSIAIEERRFLFKNPFIVIFQIDIWTMFGNCSIVASASDDVIGKSWNFAN